MHKYCVDFKSFSPFLDSYAFVLILNFWIQLSLFLNPVYKALRWAPAIGSSRI